MKKIRFLFLMFLISCSPHVTITPELPVTSTSEVLEITETSKVLTETPVENEPVILDFAISPDGDKLAIYLNTEVYLYNIETLKRTVFYEFESGEYYSELSSPATIYPPFDAPGSLAFSPDGTKLAISNKFQDEFIHVWDLKSHEIIDYIGNYPNGNFVRELAYSPTGNELLIRSTYPKSRIQCPEMANPPQDTLTLISLFHRENLCAERNCNRYSVLEYHLLDSSNMYFFHFGAASYYFMYQVDIQTGNVLASEEIHSNLDGRIYDVSKDGKTFAAYSYFSNTLNTTLLNTRTREKLNSITGWVDLLSNEKHYLLSTFETSPPILQGELKLYENEKVICTFDGIEYYRPYTKISIDNTILASLTFDNRVFKNSIQIWDISSCKLINIIPFE